MKYDIDIVDNHIGGRQGFAYICNSMKFTVLEADMCKEQKYNNYRTYASVRVATKYKNTEITAKGKLEFEDGKYFIGCNGGCCISSRFCFEDKLELVKNASLPVVRKDDIIAIAVYSKKINAIFLELYKVGKIDTNCMRLTNLIPLTDEEMEQVKMDAVRWLER